MRELFWRAGGFAKVQLARLRGRSSAQGGYETRAPSPQHALDLFRGEWTSALPPKCEGLEAGTLPLFADRWLSWGIDRLGGVDGQRVLELGPLEGAHSWLLASRGAASVTAVEASRRAYLKCLVMKEVLGTDRVRVLLGDCVAYLAEPPQPRFDVAIAAGILYHMTDPVTLLARLSRAADRLYLWTMYYDEAAIGARPKLAARFRARESRTVEGFPHTLHIHSYQAAGFQPGFCGGAAGTSRWLSRADILGALRHFGFDDIEVGSDDPAGPNGPALALIARRTAGGPRADSIRSAV